MVYGREIDDQVTTFGTTGYTYRDTFVLYDRASHSIWYPHKPGEMNAVSGPLSGKVLRFLAEPELMSLAEWGEKYSDSLVLVPDKAPAGARALQ